jgi:arsenate reductase
MKMERKKAILFLCTGNSCRSQIAEGLARYLKSDFVIPYSAGVETHGLNPNAVQVMQEIGIDITAHKSQHIDEFKDIHLDYVVAVCDKASQSCPIFPGDTTVIRRPFDDPPALAKDETDPEKALDHYRRVRDEIKAFVEELPGVLTAG